MKRSDPESRATEPGIELRFRPGEGGRQRLLGKMQSFAQQHRVPGPVFQAIDLALEEHLTNVENHGGRTGELEITVRLRIVANSLVAEVEDSGSPFNPLDRPEVDVNAPLEHRAVGGLGIHLMRKMSDELSYRREAGRNILRMSKLLGPGEA